MDDDDERYDKLVDDSYVIFAGSGNPHLAAEVAFIRGVELSPISLGAFADGERAIKLGTGVRGKNVYIIQPTGPPVHDNLMELLLLISCCRRASARTITAVVPYFSYATQDRKRHGRDTVAGSDVCKLLEAVGVDHVLCVDIHRRQLEGFFETATTESLETLRLPVGHLLSKSLYNPVIVCPSATGIGRAKAFRQLLQREGVLADLAFVSPAGPQGIRDEESLQHHRTSDKHIIVGNVEHRDVILIDDMIDTASRICAAADLCKAKGAHRVFAFATHGIFSPGAHKRIDESELDEVVVTNTIETTHFDVTIDNSDHGITLASGSNVVEAVRKGSPADMAGILPGQSIGAINGWAASPEECHGTLRQLRPPFVLTVNKGNISDKVLYTSVGPVIAEAIRRLQARNCLGSMTHLETG